MALTTTSHDMTLARQLAWQAAIVESCPDAIIGIDLDGVVVSWNGAAARLLGYAFADIVGRPWRTLLRTHSGEEPCARMADLLQGAPGSTIELIDRTGALVDGVATLSPIRDRSDATIGASIIVRPPGRCGPTADNDEFLSTLSHELRAPLHAILGWAQVLEHSATPSMRHGLAIIERNARLQAQLLEDLLDVGRGSSGKLRLEIAPVDLGTILSERVDSIRPAAEAKRLELTLRSPSYHCEVLGDATRLQQVLWNLLSNAVRYTAPGGRVEASLQGGPNGFRIEVTDSGVGIDSEFLPHVFTRYAQAHAPTGEQGGLGLGLAIARQLVELHGGTVTAASDGPGRGSTFTVTLPRVPEAPRPRIDRRSSAPATVGARASGAHGQARSRLRPA
ncbi:MAG: PAS domain-containing sensor histidine kinase [Deltaproteobacteria bacterium]|nr:PAS domain-containing sensor histidine kinase [Deltaproteobacteria bacterium]MBK8716542.1 PAS domain-containing sensor histidine kinase [Deltaproteobacteria bacterium]